MSYNKWNFLKEDVVSFSCRLIDQLNAKQHVLEISKLIIDLGVKYNIFYLENNENVYVDGEEFIYLLENSVFGDLESLLHVDVFTRLVESPNLSPIYKFKINLAIFNNSGNIIFKKFSTREELVPFLPSEFDKQNRYEFANKIFNLNLHTLDETIYFGFSTNCQLFAPYFINDSFDTDLLVDNRELYFLNYPRLKGFKNEIDKYFLNNGGKLYNDLEIEEADFIEYKKRFME